MLKRTALFEEHVKLGGRMVDFGGWELPVQYSGVMDEHLACRSAAGLFDVSHMGEFHVEGAAAEKFLNFLLTNDIVKVSVGQAQYNVMCHAEGGIVDDLVIYRRAADRFLVVVNASNTDKDFAHFQKVAREYFSDELNQAKLTLTNESAKYTQIAIQGQVAEKILQHLTGAPLRNIKTYWFGEGTICGSIPAILARTGYTGEDGFEIYVPWENGPQVWQALLEVGAPLGLKPVGLGARDTLRLEMKYPLYGHELTDHTNPLEAGLGWVTKLQKQDFMGKTAIEKAQASGLARKSVGFKVQGRGIPRQDYAIFDETGKAQIGKVTSGTQSPSLKDGIGVGYVDLAHAAIGSAITIDIRGSKVPAQVVKTPFYTPPYRH